MKTKISFALLLPALLFLLAHAQAPFDEEKTKVEGAKVVKEIGGLLSSNLMQAIAKGGFTNALQFCSVHALEITDQIPPGVEVRRVSTKTRNETNKPDKFEEQVLSNFVSKAKRGEPLTPLVMTNKDVSRFFAPIPLDNPLCLNCHGMPGSQIKPETLGVIMKLYPHDQATGYTLGDVRGMWSVTFKPAAAKQDE